MTGLLWHLTTITPSILGLSRWNNNWNIKKNSWSYVAMATKIQFHFQFPRPSDAAFGGGWLLNWMFQFGCRRISNITNHAKCSYFLDDDGINNVTLRLWKFSDFCSRHTVGVAGDIMYHILVCFIITCDSEVIMFSPCVFVCLCVSMFVTMFVRTI